MLDNTLKHQLSVYLEKLTRPVELIATLDDSNTSGEVRELLEEISGLSDKISLRLDDSLAVRKPSL